MKIALTVWNGRIAPLFDVAGTVVVVSIEDGAIVSTVELPVPSTAGTLQRISLLRENGVQVLLCGAVSRQVHRMLAVSEVEVHSFVSGDADDVLEAFLRGNLEADSFRMPGCGRGRGRGTGRGAGFNRRGRNRGSCPRGKEV